MSWASESRIKRKLVFSNEENKKKSSVSVWSEEDDISLLKGVVNYEALNQSSPYDDMGKFLDSVKPSLHFDVKRKQLTDRLWRLKKRFLDSNYDLSKPHHAKLFELAKSIKAWGNHASVSLDGDKGVENVSVTSDVRNGKKDDVVVGGVDVSKVVQNKDKGKLGTGDVQIGKKNNLVVGDVHVDKLVQNKGMGKLGTSDVRNGEKVDVDVDKSSKLVKISAGQKNTMVVDDVDGSKCLKVVKDKKTRKVVISDDQNVEDDNAVVDDFQSAKKNGKKRVKVLGDENGPREVNRKDLEYCTSKYPKLTNIMIDTIKYMGKGKANKLEEKWADLVLMELELQAKKLDLRTKQINLILDLEAARRKT